LGATPAALKRVYSGRKGSLSRHDRERRYSRNQ